ncbi:hypothetical protein ACX8Z9_07890 [Arthrobacter halodurans]|uniref:Uncharacterized protein n=1 Tax=Arthrobacter halodurans TaxID=516699 RepID=A0ABV4UJE3_9MICC
MKRKLPAFAGAAAAGAAMGLLAVTGCSPPSPQENVSQACAASDAMASAIEEFRAALSADATVEEVRTARDKVSDAYDTLTAEMEDVAEDRVNDLEANVDEFRSAVDQVPDDAQLSDALESLGNEASDVRTALDGVDSDLNC